MKIINKKKIKICFVSLNSSHLLSTNTPNYVGGAEIQQVALAKELYKRGYDISFIVYGLCDNNSNTSDKFNIEDVYDINDSSRYSIFKKIWVIWKKMKKNDADIYFHRSGSPGIVSIFCWIHNKKMICSIASDSQVTNEQIIKQGAVKGALSKLAVWIDIVLSNITVCQNVFQKSNLEKRFHTNSIIIKNCIDISKIDNINSKKDKKIVMWVGTIRPIKQPRIFLEIARRIPNIHFVMIGGPGDNSELYEIIKKDAENITNLEFKGFRRREEIFNEYKKSILLVNTSKIEGFPNVFLEAWSFTLPVVSLCVDPDDIIKKEKLGYQSTSLEKMIMDIRKLSEDDVLCKKMGQNGRRYVEENHDIQIITDRYEGLIQKLSS